MKLYWNGLWLTYWPWEKTIEIMSLSTAIMCKFNCSFLTMFPWIDNWPHLGSSLISMEGIRGDISWSSSDIKFNTSGLQGEPILLTLQQLGNLPFLDLNYKLCRSIQCQQRFKISKTGLGNRWWTCLVIVWITLLFHNRALEPQLVTTAHTHSGPHAMFSIFFY